MHGECCGKWGKTGKREIESEGANVSRISLLIEYAFISQRKKEHRTCQPFRQPPQSSHSVCVRKQRRTFTQIQPHTYTRTHTQHSESHTHTHIYRRRVSHRARRENQNYAHTLPKFLFWQISMCMCAFCCNLPFWQLQSFAIYWILQTQRSHADTQAHARV